MSEDPSSLPPEDQDLEAELRKLVPNPLKADFFDELQRDQKRIAANQTAVNQRISNRRRNGILIGSMVACVVVLVGITLKQSQQPSVAIESEAGGAESLPTQVAATIPTKNKSVRRSDALVPVSSKGYLINAAAGGIIESEDGPRQRLRLDFEDVDYWHDPNTSTDIQIISPRQEVIIVPLRTD